eukprot:Hpha_TRINITY_DN15032_c3_g1::TRINITY_DN15032_c3_g1_i1::g.124214::m.124214
MREEAGVTLQQHLAHAREILHRIGRQEEKLEAALVARFRLQFARPDLIEPPLETTPLQRLAAEEGWRLVDASPPLPPPPDSPPLHCSSELSSIAAASEGRDELEVSDAGRLFGEDQTEPGSSSGPSVTAEPEPSPERSLVLLLTVDLGGGRNEVLSLRATDDPEGVAAAFVVQHGLPGAVTWPLAQRCRDSLQRATERRRLRASAQAPAAAEVSPVARRPAPRRPPPSPPDPPPHYQQQTEPQPHEAATHSRSPAAYSPAPYSPAAHSPAADHSAAQGPPPLPSHPFVRASASPQPHPHNAANCSPSPRGRSPAQGPRPVSAPSASPVTRGSLSPQHHGRTRNPPPGRSPAAQRSVPSARASPSPRQHSRAWGTPSPGLPQPRTLSPTHARSSGPADQAAAATAAGARLYALGLEQMQARADAVARRQRESEEAEVRAATFAPQINSSSRRCPSGRRSGSARDRVRSEDLELQQCTFRPRLSQGSLRILQKRRVREHSSAGCTLAAPPSASPPHASNSSEGSAPPSSPLGACSIRGAGKSPAATPSPTAPAVAEFLYQESIARERHLRQIVQAP